MGLHIGYKCKCQQNLVTLKSSALVMTWQRLTSRE